MNVGRHCPISSVGATRVADCIDANQRRSCHRVLWLGLGDSPFPSIHDAAMTVVVDRATTLSEASAFLAARQYSIVVIDACFLSTGWLDVVAMCRRDRGDLPIVVTGPELDVRLDALAVRTGATDVIPYP